MNSSGRKIALGTLVGTAFGPHELEEVCFGPALVQRTKSSGPNPVYYVLGQTLSGRHLLCVVIQFPDGKGFPVTARPMTPGEKKRYNRWKRP